MSKYYLLNGKIEIYNIEKFKDWLFKELQEQEFVGVFDINIDEETDNAHCQKCGKSGEDVDLYGDINPVYLCRKCFETLWD